MTKAMESDSPWAYIMGLDGKGVAMFHGGGARWLAYGLVLFLAGCFREKDFLDAEVRQLCAKDGGVKVYERVQLPSSRFDRFGEVDIPSKEKYKNGDEFYFTFDVHYYKKGNPEMWRATYRLYRYSDQFLMSEGISYARRGGDFPDLFRVSLNICPDDAGIKRMQKEVFYK